MIWAREASAGEGSWAAGRIGGKEVKVKEAG